MVLNSQIVVLLRLHAASLCLWDKLTGVVGLKDNVTCLISGIIMSVCHVNLFGGHVDWSSIYVVGLKNKVIMFACFVVVFIGFVY